MARIMFIQKKAFIFILIIIAWAIIIYSQEKRISENADPLLSEIAAKIDSYKNKIVTLRLKLKLFDRTFEKISFYDRKNHDIEFDISSKETKSVIKNDMNDIHEGMVYLVTFRIRNTGKLNEVNADLLSFKPAVLEILPAGAK